MSVLTSMEELDKIYHTPPTLASTAKEIDTLSPHYRQLIAVSPFLILATAGPEGLDCSPRGDRPGFVRIADERTLIIPDRRGNNRIDSLRNIIRDPRVALLFLIPGSGTTFRVNGRARISADPDLLSSFAVDGKTPRTAIIVTVERAYFQCARAVVRSELWNAARHIAANTLPSPGAILEELTAAQIDGKFYDAEWPSRAAKSLW
jgi:PPOX class probable FMN-dependent enzyme